MRAVVVALVAGLAATHSAPPPRAQSSIENYEIMRPEQVEPKYEPWLAPKYKSPRGVKRRRVPKIEAAPATRAATAPPIVAPRTGRALPNLPGSVGSGPGGAETSQDRALRCAHQSGVYGPATGGGSYLGACINQ